MGVKVAQYGLSVMRVSRHYELLSKRSQHWINSRIKRVGMSRWTQLEEARLSTLKRERLSNVIHLRKDKTNRLGGGDQRIFAYIQLIRCQAIQSTRADTKTESATRRRSICRKIPLAQHRVMMMTQLSLNKSYDIEHWKNSSRGSNNMNSRLISQKCLLNVCVWLHNAVSSFHKAQDCEDISYQKA